MNIISLHLERSYYIRIVALLFNEIRKKIDYIVCVVSRFLRSTMRSIYDIYGHASELILRISHV